MKKVELVFILFCMFSRLAFGQGEEYYGILSQMFYDRFYDRSFDLNFQTNGAQAAGMGLAYLAIAKDPTALLLNPAGATQLRSFSISAIGRFDFDSREYQEPKNSGIKVISDIKPLFSLNSVSLAFPVTIVNRQLVVGLTYRSLGSTAKYIDDTHYYYGGGSISEIKDIGSGSYTISPSLAVEIIPKFAIGATYHFILGESKYDLKILSPYADKTLYYSYKDKEKYSNSFVDLGLFVAPIKWFSIGLIFTPSWKYLIDEKSESYTVSDYSTETGWIYETFNTPEDSLDKFKIDIPASYGIGLAVKPISSLTFAFDYRTTNWSTSKISVNDTPAKNDLSDVQSFHVGIEYRVKFGLWRVPLRGGYYSKPIPNKDQWFNNEYEGDQIEYDAITLGLGLYKGLFKIDFAFEHGSRQQSWWRGIGDYYNSRSFITVDETNRATVSLSYEFNF